MKRRMLYMRSTPGQSAAILYLLAAGLALLPTQWLGSLFTQNEQIAQSLGLGIVRLVSCAVLLVLAFHMGIRGVWAPAGGKALLFALPALAVAVNNLPVVALAQGTAGVTGTAGAIAAFALECAGVALFEETAFRGIVFPFVLGKTGTGRKGRFRAVVISAALFGALHLVNIIGNWGAAGAVLLQVGYSFLIGSMLAVCAFRGAGVWACALVHAAFNFCGSLINDGRGFGGFSQVWCPQEIVLTAVVGVCAAAYFVWLLLKSPSAAADRFAVFPPQKGEEATPAPPEEKQE